MASKPELHSDQPAGERAGPAQEQGSNGKSEEDRRKEELEELKNGMLQLPGLIDFGSPGSDREALAAAIAARWLPGIGGLRGACGRFGQSAETTTGEKFDELDEQILGDGSLLGMIDPPADTDGRA